MSLRWRFNSERARTPRLKATEQTSMWLLINSETYRRLEILGPALDLVILVIGVGVRPCGHRRESECDAEGGENDLCAFGFHCRIIIFAYGHRSSPQIVISKDKKMATNRVKSAVIRRMPANVVDGKIETATTLDR